MAKTNNFMRRVNSVLKSYKTNGPAMLEIIVGGVHHIREDGQKTPLLRIANALYGEADYSIFTSIVRQMTDGSVTISANSEGVDVKVNKRTGFVEHEKNTSIARKAVAEGVAFRNKKFLADIGVRVTDAKPFDEAGAMSSLVKRAFADARKNNKTPPTLSGLKAALEAAYHALAAEEAVKDNKPVASNTSITRPTNALAGKTPATAS